MHLKKAVCRAGAGRARARSHPRTGMTHAGSTQPGYLASPFSVPFLVFLILTFIAPLSARLECACSMTRCEKVLCLHHTPTPTPPPHTPWGIVPMPAPCMCDAVIIPLSPYRPTLHEWWKAISSASVGSDLVRRSLMTKNTSEAWPPSLTMRKMVYFFSAASIACSAGQRSAAQHAIA